MGLTYEPVMTRCLARLLRELHEPHFMDVGSFVGYYACYAGALLGSDTNRVSAVESNPLYCEATRRSCELNGLSNVRVYEAALLDSPAPFSIDSRSVVPIDTPAPEARTATTLDRLCESEGIAVPNVIKMDIHGSEGKALRGMTAALQKMDYLLLELHGEYRLRKLSDMRRSDVLQLLWDANLSVYQFAGHRDHPDSFREGEFAYQQVTPANAGCLFFDRPHDVFLLVTPRNDMEAVFGESVKGGNFCY
jgi:FkbM family methyltransferase